MKDELFEELTEEELAIVAGGCGQRRRSCCSRRVVDAEFETIRISASSSSSLSSISSISVTETRSNPVTITVRYLPTIDKYT